MMSKPFKHLKPRGLSILNPLAWWRWFRIRSYADHVRSLNPIWYSEDEVEVGWTLGPEITYTEEDVLSQDAIDTLSNLDEDG